MKRKPKHDEKTKIKTKLNTSDEYFFFFPNGANLDAFALLIRFQSANESKHIS